MARRDRDARLERVRHALDRIGERREIQARASVDPASFVHGYDDPLDQEIVGLVASSLAFGNVKAFRPKIQDALERLGPHPSQAGSDRSSIERKLKGWKHRVYRAGDLAGLVAGACATQAEHGSLGALFARELDARGGDLQAAASAFARAVRRGGGLDRLRSHGAKHILVDPAQGSASKRLLLFFRWMIRPADGVDVGLWPVPARALLIPVDVHIHRLARNLGFTKRASASWQAAVEITDVLRRFDAEDPVRYDFPLCHMGMLQHCPSRRDEARCEGCGVKPVCLHWERR